MMSAQVGRLPVRFQKAIKRNYAAVEKQHGRFDAEMATLDMVRAVGGADPLLAANDADLREFAKMRAQECFEAATFWKGADLALAAMRNVALRYGIEPPHGRYVTLSGQRGRLLDAAWWVRQVRRLVARKFESAAITVGLVHRFAGLYASNEAVTRRRSQRARNRALLESIKAVNDLGQEYTLQALSDLGVSNPALRRMELMTRLAGFDAMAQAKGHAGEFYTLTAPSKYHARDSLTGKVNPNYQGFSPRDTQDYLAQLWARARAALHRRGLRVYGFRICEPHHDGCPHWHMVLFMDSAHVAQVRAILKRYALAVDGSEPGAARRRFEAKAIDRSKGSAVAYLAKYIAKNIDGFNVGEDYEAIAGEDSAESSARRVDAWASTWGIRQFQQIGGASVMVWRELRRMDAESVESEFMRAIIGAADGAEWDRYNTLNGGVFAGRSGALVTSLYEGGAEAVEGGELVALNKYGEPAGAAIKGVVCDAEEYQTRLRVWVFQRSGAAVQPWSSVNNCTGSPAGAAEVEREFAERIKNREKIAFSPVDFTWKKKLLTGEAWQI